MQIKCPKIEQVSKYQITQLQDTLVHDKKETLVIVPHNTLTDT